MESRRRSPSSVTAASMASQSTELPSATESMSSASRCELPGLIRGRVAYYCDCPAVFRGISNGGRSDHFVDETPQRAGHRGAGLVGVRLAERNRDLFVAL